MIPNFKFALTEELINKCNQYNGVFHKEIKKGIIKKINPKDFLPIRSEELSTGWDVRSTLLQDSYAHVIDYISDDSSKEHWAQYAIQPTEYVKIPLGFRVFAPEGWWLKLAPRSSTFMVKQCHYLLGTVDESYQGEVCFAAQYIPNEFEFECDINNNNGYVKVNVNIDNKPLIIPFGERIAQLIPVPRYDMCVENISNEEYDKLCDKRGGKRGAGGFGSSGR